MLYGDDIASIRQTILETVPDGLNNATKEKWKREIVRMWGNSVPLKICDWPVKMSGETLLQDKVE